MAPEQLGVGDSSVPRVIPGPVQLNGVTTPPTISTVNVTVTTTNTNVAANSTAINSILAALENLGLAVRGPVA